MGWRRFGAAGAAVGAWVGDGCAAIGGTVADGDVGAAGGRAGWAGVGSGNGDGKGAGVGVADRGAGVGVAGKGVGVGVAGRGAGVVGWCVGTGWAQASRVRQIAAQKAAALGEHSFCPPPRTNIRQARDYGCEVKQCWAYSVKLRGRDYI